jgi:acetyl esterase
MDQRLHPEMRATKQRMDEAASQWPPVSLTPPLDPSRIINDKLNLMHTSGGPMMAATRDGFVFAQGRRVLCRMHRPVVAETLPVLIWFHGGGWVWSSIDTHDRLVREYAAGAGVATINVDYSLSPEARFPRALLECADVVRKVAAEAAEWGIDPSRIAIGGDSAGGNLALATALLLRGQGGPALRGVLTPYPVTSADFERGSWREFAEGYGLTRAGMMAYWDLYLRDAADRLNPLAAPVLADVTGFPPTLIQLAELDILRDEGLAMAEKLRAAGVDVTVETVKGVLHGFMRLTGTVTPAADAVARANAWLRRVLD